MNSRWLVYVVAAVAFALVASTLALSTGAIAPYLGDGYQPEADSEPPNGDYEHTTVAIYDAESSEELGRVETAIADTFSKRYLGLSDTDELPVDRGMLSVHDGTGERTYVMRNMSFGIDIVFIDAEGSITAIHEAPAPGPGEDGNAQEYSGEAKYVLEVNEEWTSAHDVEVGDEARFEL